MTLAPAPSRKPATFEVQVFPPPQEPGLESYREHLIVDEMRVHEDELPDFVEAFKIRAERWFELQRQALALISGRGRVDSLAVRLDWTSQRIEWPRVTLCAEAANLNLDAAQQTLVELERLCALTPAWSLADLGGRPHDAKYGDERPMISVYPDEHGTLTVGFPGTEERSSRTLTQVPATASAKEIKRTFKRMQRDAERLSAWADEQQASGTCLWAYLSRDWASGYIIVRLTLSRGSWEDREQVSAVWTGEQLDLDALHAALPSFDTPVRGPLLGSDAVMQALRSAYDFRNGAERGATFYSPKYPMMEF